MRKQKGFTLVELLVVIAIIGLLSTLAVVALGNARAKSRDARRVSDAKQISTALELFFNDCGNYPSALTTANSQGCPSGVTLGSYLATVPVDPGTNSYAYASVSPYSTYSLTFTTEGVVQGIGSSGPHTASPSGIQ